MRRTKRYLALILAVVFLLGIVPMHTFAAGNLPGDARNTETVTVTVNYVYANNHSMVTSPWSAQITKGTAFQQKVSVPNILNFYVDQTTSQMPADVTYTAGASVTEPGTLTFSMASVQSNVDVVLYYKPENVNFTVNHYYQKVESDAYDSPEVITGSGSVEAYAEFAVRDREGFYCLGKPEVILHGKDAEINLYYNREYQFVQFDLDGGTNGPEPIYAKYGSQFDTSTWKKPSKPGYIFDKWVDENGNPISGSLTLTRDLTVRARWLRTKVEAAYKFVIWHQNANDDEYSYDQTIPGTAMSGTQIQFGELWFCNQEQHVHDASCYVLQCSENHAHTDNCYTRTCRKTEHVHDSWCYDTEYINLDEIGDKWYVAKTETGIVEPDGSTVLNVYLNRRTYTLTFEYSPTGGYTSSAKDSITARWGQNIGEQYRSILAKTYKNNSKWVLENGTNNSNSTEYTDYFGIMPIGNYTYINDSSAIFGEGSMYYYGKDLNGQDQLIFQVNNVGDKYVGTQYEITLTTSETDYFDFEGFSVDRARSTPVKQPCAGATIYYNRNSYDLVYMNGVGNAEHRETLLYQQPMDGYENRYTPTAPTDSSGYAADDEFVGWYKDPTGQVPVDFNGAIMPSNNIVMYAKWVDKRYTVTTYTNAQMQKMYTYTGYEGFQKVERNKTPSVLPADPPATEEGMFLGWYYRDENNTEKRFSFIIPITHDYNLYPKYTKQYPISYTVEYLYEYYGTLMEAAPSETRTNVYGTNVTELAKPARELINIPSAERDMYFPDETRKSVVLDQENLVIRFIYEPVSSVRYQIRYVDTAGRTIAPAVEKTTNFAIVTETYKHIPNYIPMQYQITQELVANPDFTQGENTIVFVYSTPKSNLTITKQGVVEGDDSGAPFVFQIEGETVRMEIVIYGNGSKTIADLPAGTYTVRETTGYWRYALDTEKTVELTSGQTAAVTFTNSRKDDKWLDDFAGATNVFGNGK